jgi:hypothetical protein
MEFGNLAELGREGNLGAREASSGDPGRVTPWIRPLDVQYLTRIALRASQVFLSKVKASRKSPKPNENCRNDHLVVDADVVKVPCSTLFFIAHRKQLGIGATVDLYRRSNREIMVTYVLSIASKRIRRAAVGCCWRQRTFRRHLRNVATRLACGGRCAYGCDIQQDGQPRRQSYREV